MKYKLSHFAYNLPENLIAKKPAVDRDKSKLMVIDRSTGKIEHKIFYCLFWEKFRSLQKSG